MRRAKIQAEDGTILRGLPALAGPGRSSRDCHVPRLGGVKPHIDPYAASFAEAGFAVLNFDNRGWGTSEGEPRQELNVFNRSPTCATPSPSPNHSRSSTPNKDLAFGGRVSRADWRSSPPPMTRGCDVWSRRFRMSVVTAMRSSCFAGQRLEIRRRAAIDRPARLAGEPPMMVPMFSDDPDELCAFPGEFPEVPRSNRIRDLEQPDNDSLTGKFHRVRAGRVDSLHHTQAAADDPRRTRSMHLHQGSAGGV